MEFQKKYDTANLGPNVYKINYDTAQALAGLSKKSMTPASQAGLSKKNYDTASGPAGGRSGRPALKELRYTDLEEFQEKL